MTNREILTVIVDNDSYDTPEGANEIMMNNTSNKNAKFTGSEADSVPVALNAGASFSLAYIGVGRKSINIDATGGALVEVTISK